MTEKSGFFFFFQLKIQLSGHVQVLIRKASSTLSISWQVESCFEEWVPTQLTQHFPLHGCIVYKYLNVPILDC